MPVYSRSPQNIFQRLAEKIQKSVVKPHITARGIDIYDIYKTPAFQTTLVVEPRDTRQLNEACADLETQVINARGFSEALDPALALSYVNDSVAIPYLEGLISSRQLVDGYAITGLERIGTDDAIEALRLAAKSENKNTAVLANQALARLARKMSEKPGRTK